MPTFVCCPPPAVVPNHIWLHYFTVGLSAVSSVTLFVEAVCAPSPSSSLPLSLALHYWIWIVPFLKSILWVLKIIEIVFLLRLCKLMSFSFWKIMVFRFSLILHYWHNCCSCLIIFMFLGLLASILLFMCVYSQSSGLFTCILYSYLISDRVKLASWKGLGHVPCVS